MKRVKYAPKKRHYFWDSYVKIRIPKNNQLIDHKLTVDNFFLMSDRFLMDSLEDFFYENF